MSKARTNPMTRFEKFIDRTGDCWLWTGWTAGTRSTKYGYFNIHAGERMLAHRYAYTAWVGDIPEGMQIDHLCGNVLCVNPAHLEPVSEAENKRRARLTTCRSGKHDLTDPANVQWDDQGRRRGCIECHREKARARSAVAYAARKKG